MTSISQTLHLDYGCSLIETLCRRIHIHIDNIERSRRDGTRRRDSRDKLAEEPDLPVAGVEKGKTRGDGRAGSGGGCGAMMDGRRRGREGRGRRGGRVLENDARRGAQHRRRGDRRRRGRSLRRPVLVPEDLFTYAGYAPNLVRFSSNTVCDTESPGIRPLTARQCLLSLLTIYRYTPFTFPSSRYSRFALPFSESS